MSFSQPLVSTIIVTHNRPELLRKAIAAVRTQTYTGPIETIVVFDQEKPDESLVCESVDRPVRVIANLERTPGLAGARNTGILAATGEFVAFCDDDDYWLPTKTETQLASIGESIASIAGITVNYGDRQIDRVPDRETFTLENVVRYRLMEGHPSSMIVRRDAVLNKIGLVDEVLPNSYGEDFDFIIRVMQAGSLSIVERPLVVVLWGQSLFQRDWGSIVEALDYLVDKHAAFRADRRAMARIYGQRGFANASLGKRSEAIRDAGRALVKWPLEKRILAIVPVASGMISSPTIMDIANRHGRGI